MRVGQRLFLAVIPAILGVFTVVALAYWGRMSYRAPQVLVVIATAASVLSLIIAWTNTRYVAQRIERLAGRSPQKQSSRIGVVRDAIAGAARGRSATTTQPDEIDQIESVVDHLSNAVASAEADRSRTREEAHHRQQEYAALLSQISTSTLQKMDDVRLPIHILLENRFGDLNDNQEEMLGAARTAVESADLALRQLRDLLELDLGRVDLRYDRVSLNDMVQSVLPLVQADAERAGVHVALDLAPGIPALRVDRSRFQRALSSLLRAHVNATPRDSEIRLATDVGGGEAVVSLEPATIVARDPEVVLAERVVLAHGGELRRRDKRVEIAVPVGASIERTGT